jgi:DNA-binding PadR family transcriptional regulator
VVSRHPNGIHGYALKLQFERTLGKFWQLNFGEIYRVLDRLASDGLIEQLASESVSRLKLYRITEKGQRSLDDFILTAPTDTPRPLRQELAVKLLFVTEDRLDKLLQLINEQRNTYLRELSKLIAQRRKVERLAEDHFVTLLLIDWAELSVRAELEWLDQVTARLKARFGRKP